MKFSCKESKATKDEQVKKYVVCVILVLASVSTVRAQQADQPDPQAIQTAPDWQHHHFEVSSTTFENNTTLPLSMIFNHQSAPTRAPLTEAPAETSRPSCRGGTPRPKHVVLS